MVEVSALIDRTDAGDGASRDELFSRLYEY